MSRCFPFPPPGYENKAAPAAQSDHSIPRRKEKRKEKKHKKDGGKKERKEKRDKEKGKDKHKGKKDRKEKHKKDKEKSRKSEKEKDVQLQSEARHGEGSIRKLDDSKFREDLAKRYQDEERSAAKQSANDLPMLSQKISMGCRVAFVSDKEVSVNKFAPMSTSMAERCDRTEKTNSSAGDMASKRNKATISEYAEHKEKSATAWTPPEITTPGQRGNGDLHQFSANQPDFHKKLNDPTTSVSIWSGERTSSGKASFKEKSKSSETLPNSFHEKRENGRARQPFTNFASSVQGFDDTSISCVSQMEIEAHGKETAKTSMTIQRTNGIWSSDRSSICSERQAGPYSVSVTLEKERKESKNAHSAVDQRTVTNSTYSPLFKDATGRIEQIPKLVVVPRGDGKSELEKRSHKEKKKRKDDRWLKDRKDSAKIARNGEHKSIDQRQHHDKSMLEDINNSEVESPVHSGGGKYAVSPDFIKKRKDNGEYKSIDQRQHHDKSMLEHINYSEVEPPVHSGVGKCAVSPDSIKKRKSNATNGFLQNHDTRPTKTSRTHISDVCAVNGITALWQHPLTSPIAAKEDRVIDEKVNGNKKTDANLQDIKAYYGDEYISMRKPHPDSKYLPQVYAVPKLEEWPEFDDQDWLFEQRSHGLKCKSDDDARSFLVWADAVKLESADIVALPFVIPF